ncbi:hypothetical protein C8034_v003116 [Colletotrichum sidae]|uniref:Uncharacterized protein n=1 Tax=Colletotrichum sidae TaxID=1347389 RepID=A0A4R8SM81_9PEZI|nr:hypothetical protein C8034_v003116 [Colletotrichum sidae]
MKFNLIKIINNYKNYNYFYKSPKKLVLYKSNFIDLLSSFIMTIIIFSLNILLENEVTSSTKRYRIKVIRRNLVFKIEVFKDNSKDLRYIL